MGNVDQKCSSSGTGLLFKGVPCLTDREDGRAVDERREEDWRTILVSLSRTPFVQHLLGKQHLSEGEGVPVATGRTGQFDVISSTMSTVANLDSRQCSSRDSHKAHQQRAVLQRSDLVRHAAVENHQGPCRKNCGSRWSLDSGNAFQ